MTYRIIKATEKSGQERYYIQKRVLWLFWAYTTELSTDTYTFVRFYFDTKEEAESDLKLLIEQNNLRKQRKIVKREVVK